MHRLLILAAAVALTAVDAGTTWSQELKSFPEYRDLNNATVKNFPLGDGFYLSWIKILACWLIFLVWVRSVDWMSQDGAQLRLQYRRWNMLAFFTFVAAFVLLWVLPWFWLAVPLMLLAWAVPFICYVVHRNGKVAVGETVFTSDHIRFWLSARLKVVGIKIAAEARRRGEGPPVELKPQGGADERANTANLLLAKQSAGYPLVQELVVDILTRRADAVLLDFTQAQVGMRFQIDGVWHDAEPREREVGDAMLAVMKTIAGLDAAQRAKRQEGSFGAQYEKVTYTCRLVSQGTKTGERALVQLSGRKKKLDRLPDLDMRPKLVEGLKAALELPRGMVVISAPPAGGLSTLFTATVGSMDRFVRGFVGVESVAVKELNVENVPVTYFDPAAGQTPASILPKLAREHPDVYVVPDMVNAQSAEMFCDQVEGENRMVVTSVRTKEASESLLRVLLLKVPPARFAASVVAAVNQRLIRKLCSKCKEGYAPRRRSSNNSAFRRAASRLCTVRPRSPKRFAPNARGSVMWVGRDCLRC